MIITNATISCIVIEIVLFVKKIELKISNVIAIIGALLILK